MNRYNAATGRRERLPDPERGNIRPGSPSSPKASQSSRAGSREPDPIDFPATSAAEKPPRGEPRRGGNGMDLSMLLRRLTVRKLEQEDLLLALILYLLWRESGDTELLIALGAFLLF